MILVFQYRPLQARCLLRILGSRRVGQFTDAIVAWLSPGEFVLLATIPTITSTRLPVLKADDRLDNISPYALERVGP